MEIFLGSTRETMADERSRTPALMPGTHCQNIRDKLHQSTFQALSENVLILADVVFTELETFCLMRYNISLLTYLLT